MTSARRQLPPWPFWPITAAAIVLDLSSKFWADRTLAPGHPVPVLDAILRLNLTHNSAFAFGLRAPTVVEHLHPWLVMLVLVGLVLLSAQIQPSDARGAGRGYLVAFALVMGGGTGNGIQMLAETSVTDFLDLGWGAHRWPIFNVADVLVTIGLARYLWLRIRDGVREEGWRRTMWMWPPGDLRSALLPPSIRGQRGVRVDPGK